MRQNDKDHSLCNVVVVVDGWYDTGYKMVCRGNVGIMRTGVIAIVLKI